MKQPRIFSQGKAHLQLWAAVVITGLVSTMAAQAQSRPFMSVGTSNGLDARVVTDLMVDRGGLLWVASREGLFLYDGYKARHFVPDASSEGAISDLDLRKVYESSDGSIWVGTNTHGLARYDRLTDRFVEMRHDSSDPLSITGDSVYDMVEDADGALWVATQTGLNRLDPSSGQFTRFVYQPGDAQSLPENYVYSLHSGPTGTLWVATLGGGISRWVPEKAVFETFDIAAATGNPDRGNDVFAIFEDARDRLWVGTRAGLFRVDWANRAAEGSVDAVFASSEDNNPVTRLIKGPGNTLLAGTLIPGVMQVDMASLEHSWLGRQGGANERLPENAVLSLSLQDDLLFVGTWGDGLFRTRMIDTPFSSITPKDGLLFANVTSIDVPAEQFGPLAGTFGRGAQFVDINEWRALAIPGHQDEFWEQGITSLEQADDGHWFAGSTRGLWELTEDGRGKTRYVHDANVEASIGPGYVTALLKQAGDKLWVGLGGSGLYLFDRESGSFESHRHESQKPTSLGGDYITALLDDGEGSIWVGTRSNGLSRCAIRPFACENFRARANDEASLPHDHVTDLHGDQEDVVWVSTHGGGLAAIERDGHGEVTGFRVYDRRSGLISEGLVSIGEDRDGSLWLGSRTGLSRLDPVSGKIANFSVHTGLPMADFNTGAAAGDDRFLYFGALNGLVSLRTGSPFIQRDPSKVVFTSIEKVTNTGQTLALFTDSQSVSVPWGNTVKLEFAVLDFSEVPHEYQYRLNPGDLWLDLGERREVTFYGLAPGSYVVEVRGKDIFGLWGTTRSLDLSIGAPFWQTAWFFTLVAAGFLLLAAIVHHFRSSQIKRRALEHQRLAELREQALETALGSKAELAMLTARQKEILQLIAEGHRTKEIAYRLGLSAKTVETHRANIMDRMNIRDVPGLVRLAIRTGLVSSHQ